MEWWTVFWAFLETNTEEAGTLAAVTGILGYLGIKRPFAKKEELALDPETIAQIKPNTPLETAALTVPQFIAIRREMKDDLEQELSKAHEDGKAELQSRIAELESQISDPEPALADARKTIVDLTTRLERMGNDIGGDRLAEAQEALAKLDFSVADEIFAEVEERHELEVKQAARAAFGRGEVAEAEVRWHDAAEHYGRAARLDPSFETLRQASAYTQLSGDYPSAHQHSAELLHLLRSGDDQEQLSNALNEHGINSRQLGHFEEAETLHREALLIDEKTIGTAHPSHATHLNNLAAVVEAQGRFEEAEKLFREALLIDEKTIGSAHSDYAIGLNNLAAVVEEQGRFEEAEKLYRKALLIDEKTIGTGHPEYAKHLNNLAGGVTAQGRFEEAEKLYGKAVTIAFNRLGAEHPETKAFQANLDRLLAEER